MLPPALNQALESLKKNEARWERGLLEHPHFKWGFRLALLNLAWWNETSKEPAPFVHQMDLWFYILAEIAYAEAHPESLRQIHQWRLLLFHEYDRALNSTYLLKHWSHPLDLVPLFQQLRMPWPLDRTLTQHLQSLALSALEKKWAHRAIQALQKNPYGSLDSYFTQQKVFLSPNLLNFSKAWTEADVQALQQEQTLRHKMELKVASYAYLKQYKKTATNQKALIQAQFLNQTLLDLTTGQQLEIPKIE